MLSFFVPKEARKRYVGVLVTGLVSRYDISTKEDNLMWKEYNPSPVGRRTGDCTVRALAKALGIDWESAYVRLCMNGYAMGSMPDSKEVFSATLRKNGFYRKAIPNTCPDCYTAADFCEDNPDGIFVLGFDSHVATVVDGDIYDTYDISKEVPLIVWYEEDMPPKGDEDEL